MSIEKIPVTIITGFLGAGKTTLVRHLCRTRKEGDSRSWSTSSATSASTAIS